MKKVNIYKYIGVIILALLSSLVFAQKKDQSVKNGIDSMNYIFKAQTAHPTNGQLIRLSSDYDLKVSPDTLISYLPYFGRSYSAPIDPTKGGIHFTSTKFEYRAKRLKKGWEINMILSDAADVREINLTIFDNGRANLRVTSANRQPISFDGYVSGK